MAFHEVRFPASLSFGSIGGPERLTEVVTLANGFEERNTPWQHSRRRYDAGVAMRNFDDIEVLIAFFEARQGQINAFRWKDWTDYKSGLSTQDVRFDDQDIGFGDGAADTIQLVKIYRSGENTYKRPISKPVANTVKVGVDGVELTEGSQFNVDTTTGIITFDQPVGAGLQITAGYEFDVPVRFDIDRIYTSLASFQAGEVPNVPIVEVRI
ncbi:MAG: DUF2460 domain-containing protein [Pseudomonadota bacterium]